MQDIKKKKLVARSWSAIEDVPLHGHPWIHAQLTPKGLFVMLQFTPATCSREARTTWDDGAEYIYKDRLALACPLRLFLSFLFVSPPTTLDSTKQPPSSV